MFVAIMIVGTVMLGLGRARLCRRGIWSSVGALVTAILWIVVGSLGSTTRRRNLLVAKNPCESAKSGYLSRRIGSAGWHVTLASDRSFSRSRRRSVLLAGFDTQT
jgi:hypothetical protein